MKKFKKTIRVSDSASKKSKTRRIFTRKRKEDALMKKNQWCERLFTRELNETENNVSVDFNYRQNIESVYTFEPRFGGN